MRHILFLPLGLLLVVSCQGKVLDDTRRSHGGAGGASETARGGENSAGHDSGGTAGELAEAGSGGGDTAGVGGSAGYAEGGEGGAGEELPVNHDRWLVSQTYIPRQPIIQSVPGQTVLSLINLTNPDFAPIVLDGQSGYADSFSNDGRWLLYRSSRGAEVIAMAGPGAPQLLFTTAAVCKWAPDSSKLACLKDPNSNTATQLVYFDATKAKFGNEIAITTLPQRSEGASQQTERSLLFLSPNSLAYSYGPNDFARIDWNDGAAGAPVPLGVGGGNVRQQAPDGARVLVERGDSFHPNATALIDLARGQVHVIDPDLEFRISTNFDAAISHRPAASGESGVGTYGYYSIAGIQATLLAEDPVADSSWLSGDGQLAGDTVLRVRQALLSAVTIAPSAAIERSVPGDYHNLISSQLDPTGTFISLVSDEHDAQDLPIPDTYKSWLSQIGATGPSPAQLLDDNSLFSSFSPDGRHLALVGWSANGTEPGKLRLLDPRDPTHGKTYILEPTDSARTATWSSDSRYLGLIVGSRNLHLWLVDTLHPELAPRDVVDCDSWDTASVPPGCPLNLLFQP